MEQVQRIYAHGSRFLGLARLRKLAIPRKFQSKGMMIPVS